MDLRLVDSVAFVSGSSRGIGRAIASAFLAEGACVTITGRDSANLETTRRVLTNEFGADRLFAFCGDLITASAIEAALDAANQHWGHLDHVIANIGSGRSVAGWAVGASEWQRILDLNLQAATRLVEAALPRLIGRRAGTITLIGSIAGLEALDAPVAYSTAKAALIAYAGTIARRVARDGIRVNCIAPGNILFPGGVWDRKPAQDRAAVDAYIAAEVPLNRFGRPEEIADLAVFLSSPRAAFITGACLVADGGQTRRFA